MEKVTHAGQTFAIIQRNSDWQDGLHFCTPDDLFVQAGMWRYEKGKKLRPHRHKIVDRLATRTQELVYIRRGSLRVDLYSENKQKLQDFVLNTGDLAVFVAGGHGYEILEDLTEVLEVKNGPFIGVDKDKDMIEE
jgi:hypothetical protein